MEIIEDNEEAATKSKDTQALPQVEHLTRVGFIQAYDSYDSQLSLTRT